MPDIYSGISGESSQLLATSGNEDEGRDRAHFFRRFRNFATRFLFSIFLPEGFPYSVSKDYLTYQVWLLLLAEYRTKLKFSDMFFFCFLQIWDTVQAFCSTVTGIFARQAILKSMGVGNANAALGAALWQTVLRQNIGKIVRITFTTMKVTQISLYPRSTIAHTQHAGRRHVFN